MSQLSVEFFVYTLCPLRLLVLQYLILAGVCLYKVAVNTSVIPVSLGSFFGGRLPLLCLTASSVMSDLTFFSPLFQFTVLLSSHLLEDNWISQYLG